MNTNFIQEMPPKHCTEVNFNVKCEGTEVGDRVALVGNLKALGEWNPERAHILETSAKRFPHWFITLKLPRDLIIEYKYIIIKKPPKQVNQANIT